MLSSDHSKPAMNPTGKLLLPLLCLLAATTAFPLATRGAAPAELGSSATDMVVGCLPWERDALLAFKRGIKSDPLGLLASWRRDDGGGDHDCCRWRGVGCSNLTGHVVELQLNGAYVDERLETQGLVGEISPQLLYLDRIEHLDLSINFLQGPSGRIPEFLGSMKSLRYLSLSNIPFTGAVPPQLGNLSRLEHLDLSYLVGTHLTYLSWLSRLGSLEYLDLTSVDLSMASDWAHAVNMIPSIRVLHLCDCQIQSADHSLTHLNLTKLEELDLSSNYINHSYASCWFWNSTSLQILDISFNYLNVELPDALGEMTSLRVLNITHNYYTDIVAPGSLRRLYSLEILNIESCYLSANMTELLEILSHGSKKLRQLKMAMNDISGTIPAGILQQFADLDTLDFRNNNLTGHVPTEISMLTSLTYMDLSHNNLAGVITEEHFASLKRLKYMDLSYNPLRIAVDPGWIAPFRLQHACFAFCQMGPQFPSWLQGQVDITYFDISNAGITDKLPDQFWTTFSKVKYLDFSNNGISGALPTNMENMPMEYLQLGSNQISGQIPPLPRNITLLNVSNNSLRGPLPSELIGAQNQMEVLILSSNKLSGRIPRSLCRMQYLHTLDLANNLFGGDFPPCFGMRNVEVLLLSNNRFSGTFPAFLERCTQLLVIDLSRNNFSGKLPMWIGDKEKLLFLRVSYNVFSGFIPANFTNLKNLCHLDLASNNLSGNIPWGLSNLEAMKQKSSIVFQIYIPEEYYSSLSVVTKRQELYYGSTILDIASIDFSSNYLIGAIPGEIASLALLKNLNLSRNYLSGKIPDKIGSLESLESLDLSRNKLSGEIPLSLTNLSYLGDLDLSHNNLSGRIPSGSQLDTLYMEHPDMYNDNSGLCGPPLQRNCLGGIAPKQHGYGGHKETAHVPEPMFFYLGLVSGFIVGLWAVFCIILFKKTWRIAYFRYFDNVYDKIYVLTVVTWASLSHKMTAQ